MCHIGRRRSWDLGVSPGQSESIASGALIEVFSSHGNEAQIMPPFAAAQQFNNTAERAAPARVTLPGQAT